MVPRPEAIGQEAFAEHILHMFLDGPAQRAGAELGVVSHPGQEFSGRIVHIQGDVVLAQLVQHPLHLQVHDGFDVFQLQRMENHDAVQAVDELGPEGAAQGIHDPLLHVFIRAAFLFLLIRHLKAQAATMPNNGRAHVGGHDDDGIAEIHPTALGIGEMPIFHNLKQDVEDFGMGFFDFIQEDHRIRTAPHGFGKLTALFVAHITRRRAHQTADIMPFHELGHVDFDQGLLGAKEELGQILGQVGFAYPGGPQEDKDTDGAFGVL